MLQWNSLNFYILGLFPAEKCDDGFDEGHLYIENQWVQNHFNLREEKYLVTSILYIIACHIVTGFDD